jgi:hypothetical protein
VPLAESRGEERRVTLTGKPRNAVAILYGAASEKSRERGQVERRRGGCWLLSPQLSRYKDVQTTVTTAPLAYNIPLPLKEPSSPFHKLLLIISPFWPLFLAIVALETNRRRCRMTTTSLHTIDRLFVA